MRYYAIKANKVYPVNDNSKEEFLRQGYNIIDENGNLVESSEKTKVPYEKYEKVKNELEKANEELEKANEELEISRQELTNKTIIEILLQYAEAKGIDIGQTTTEEGILKKIKEAEK